MSSIKYRPEIDGLRAVAVVPVVLFHLGADWIQGGYMGVDVFFVISGYLITSILLKEHINGTFSFANFWMRRIRRILPALLVMILGTLLVSYFVVFRPTLSSYAGDAFAAMFSYANIAMLLKFGDYWGQAAESSPFLHTWSLAVEEQFYLFYPVLIFLLYQRRVREKVNPLFALWVITALSLALFFVAIIRYPHYGFYLLPTRAWELACGGILAILQISERRLESGWKIAPSAGLLLILVSYLVTFNSEGIGPMALLAVSGAMLVLRFSSTSEPVGRFLSTRPLVFIGKISYSLYLWHWPIVVLSKQISIKGNYDYIMVMVVGIVFMIVISILSYYYIETPTRRMKGILKFVTVLLVACSSIACFYKTPFANEPYVSTFATTKFYGLYYDISPVIPKASIERGKTKRAGIIAPERDPAFSHAYKQEGIITSAIDATPAIVVLGDSHGAMWAKTIDEIGMEFRKKSSFYTSVGNNVIFSPEARLPTEGLQGFNNEQWGNYVRTLMHNLSEWKPQLFIISCKWSIRRERDLTNVEKMIQMVSRYGTKVLILNQPPIIDAIGDNNAAQALTYLGFQPGVGLQYIDLFGNEDVERMNNALQSLAEKYPSICSVFDVNSQYRQNDSALVINNKDVLYYDDDHLSYQGTLMAKENLKARIQVLLSPDFVN